ncbi:MAG: Zn-dependent hydrolase [Alphaproteobacteria bacterium]|nr:Zn-dependent hydrolase [Alphaproteobacteria bacterium]
MPNESTQALEVSCKLRSELAANLFARLREMSFDGIGISRETYGPSETAAMELVAKEAEVHGLETEWDAARNMIVRLPGQDRRLAAVATGSHLDSVPQGGNYDGAAGVIAGLLALIEAKTQGAPRRSREVYALRGEESAWFGGPCYFGSRALFGQIEASDLASRHRETGTTLAEQMVASGADMTMIEGKQTIRPAEDFHAWFELHIEQGPVLIAKEKPVGIVTGIRGNTRRRHVTCVGEAAHSGAVPRWLRHDAVLAMSELLMRLDEHWRVLLAWGEDLVFTTGIVETDPTEHAVSRVPGKVTFAIEFRSQDKNTIENFSKILVTECEKIGGERGVCFDLGDAVSSAPAKMSGKMVALVEGEAQAAGLDYEIMPSGAGHDTAVFANAGVPATMIFVRNDKGSHNPHEAMDMADFARGTDLLTRSMIKAANSAEDMRA